MKLYEDEWRIGFFKSNLSIVNAKNDYLINQEKSKESHININYNFLIKMFSELTDEQKIKLNKNLQEISPVAKTA